MAKTHLIFDGEPLVTPHFSGIGHYVLEILRAIDQVLEEYPTLKVSVFVHYRHIAKANQYGFRNIKILRSPYSLRISNGLKRRNKQPPLDILFGKGIYVSTNYSSWPLLRSKNIPFIYDISFEKYPQFAAPANQVFLSSEVKKSIQRASYVATISENSKKELVDFYNYPPENVGVFYPSVDSSKWQKKLEPDIEACKKKYHLPEKYLLFVGNIEPRKNLAGLLKAYEQLPDELRKTYKLLLVGAKGWQDEAIHETIARINSKEESVITPSSYVTDEDLPSVMSGATLFAYPSLYEGFGIPPIEAMACGVPVVTSNNSSLPEAVGNAAIMVDAESAISIRDAITTVLTDTNLQRRLIRDGYKQVHKFSWEKSARDFLETVLSLDSKQ